MDRNDLDGDGGGVASDDRSFTGGSYTCNGAVSTYEGNLGKSHNDTEAYQVQVQIDLQNFKVLIINKPSIGFTGRGKVSKEKIQSGFLADMQMTTPW